MHGLVYVCYEFSDAGATGKSDTYFGEATRPLSQDCLGEHQRSDRSGGGGQDQVEDCV